MRNISLTSDFGPAFDVLPTVDNYAGRTAVVSGIPYVYVNSAWSPVGSGAAGTTGSQVGFRVTTNGSVALPNLPPGNLNKITGPWASTTTAPNHDANSGFSTANSRYTIPAGFGGIWTFRALVVATTANSSNPDLADIAVYINGSAVDPGGSRAGYAANSWGAQVEATPQFRVNAGDYVEVYVNGRNNSGFVILSGARISNGDPVPRTVRGLVKGDGTIARGTGFTVSRTAVGNYTVNITTTFGMPIIPIIGSYAQPSGGFSNVNATLANEDTWTNNGSTFKVYVTRADGTQFVDAGFAFLAQAV